MTSRIKIICSICLTALFFGCTKDNELSIERSIKGEWVLVESTGGLFGRPLNTQTSRELKIKKRTFKEYENGELVFESKYELGISDEPLFGTSKKTFIRFESDEKHAIIVTDTELVIIEQCSDCYRHRYTRQ